MSNEAPSIINTLYLKCHAWHSGGWEGRTTHGKVTQSLWSPKYWALDFIQGFLIPNVILQ